MSKLGAARFARKYPSVKDALLKSVLEVAVRWHRRLAGEAVRSITCNLDRTCTRHCMLA